MSTYYQRLKQLERKKLNEENAKQKALLRSKKLEDKRKRREEIASLKRMKRLGIEKKREKAYIETKERRLKKLGIKVKKEKGNGGWLFHLDKSGYKRKEGLYKKREPLIRYKSTKKTKSRKKKKGFWRNLMSL